ncbi:MAG: cupin domain-containing protein [Candidatus Altiarchaeota archaeon]|nr:cupin domain-containing protein [Candidatus Altiarchaeota archaeon]
MALGDVRKLDVHTDQRGWLAEILKQEHVQAGKPFGQFYVTTAHPGVVKANHFHSRKTEWFCVIRGNALLVLSDKSGQQREEIPIGEGNMVVVRIPPGVAHGIKNVGSDMMYLLAYIDEPYNPADPDTTAAKVVE